MWFLSMATNASIFQAARNCTHSGVDLPEGLIVFPLPSSPGKGKE
jgi:hypothetical protein